MSILLSLTLSITFIVEKKGHITGASMQLSLGDELVEDVADSMISVVMNRVRTLDLL